MHSKIVSLSTATITRPVAVSAKNDIVTGKSGAAHEEASVGLTHTDAATARRNEPPQDTARIKQLQAAVLDGSYRTDAARIADRLVGIDKLLQ
jgi:flagellar biosynthesis anti-sigma factor FlgM